jgi:hypothetical protein
LVRVAVDLLGEQFGKGSQRLGAAEFLRTQIHRSVGHRT